MSPNLFPVSDHHRSLRGPVAFGSPPSVSTVYLFAYGGVASAQQRQQARAKSLPGTCYRLASSRFAAVSGAVPDASVPVGVAVQHVLRGDPSERRH